MKNRIPLFRFLGVKLYKLFNLYVSPISNNFDDARRELVLNIILIGVIVMVFIALIHNCLAFLTNMESRGAISPLITLGFLLLLCYLYRLSRSGYFKSVAIFLIGSLLFIAFYTLVKWGNDVPSALLTWALIIVMSGILINSRFSLIVTCVISVFGIAITYLQSSDILIPDYTWKQHFEGIGDMILFLTILGIVALISFLFNRQSERAFARSREMEQELKKERDMLEEKVEERTRKIKQMQMQRLTSLYHMAEIGRMTAGFFHDLVNPLNLVLLNLDKLSVQSRTSKIQSIADNREVIDRAIRGTKHLEKFITIARNQIQERHMYIRFSVTEEINDTITLLNHKARQSGVSILFKPKSDFSIYGNSLRFNQIIVNLISNAIDSYFGVISTTNRHTVQIILTKNHGQIKLVIRDHGAGIRKDFLKKIFEPFFTTKVYGKGIGIGLTITKDIVEKEFNGSISVKSQVGNGTTFAVIFPIKPH